VSEQREWEEFTEAEKSIRRKYMIRTNAILSFLGVISIAGLGGLALSYEATGLDVETGTYSVLFLFLLVVSGYLMYQSRPVLKLLVPSPQARIADIRENLGATGRLLRELENELNTRNKILEQLQSDTERYEQLASLNAEQAKAIEDMIGQKFKRQSRATWRQWWGAIILAIIFGFIVNWISTPLLNWLVQYVQ